MQQKQKINHLLSQFFNHIEPDLASLKMMTLPPKKSIYKPGDPINHIYFIVSGEVKLIYHEKQQSIHPSNIIGDYEPMHQLTQRITRLKCVTTAKIVALPFDYYFGIKNQILEDYIFLQNCIPIVDKMARYLMLKIYTKQFFYRGQEIILETKNNQNSSSLINNKRVIKNDTAVIKEGRFKIKKYIDIALLKNQRLQVQKEFQIVDLGPNQILHQNAVCQTPKGTVFIFKSYFLNKLFENYEQIQKIMMEVCEKKQQHRKRSEDIKNTFKNRSQFLQFILPSVVNSSIQEKIPKKYKFFKTKLSKQQQMQTQKEYNYRIARSEEKKIKCEPTSHNFSLIPFFKARTPNIIQVVSTREKKRDQLLKILNYKSEKQLKHNIYVNLNEKEELGVEMQLTKTKNQHKSQTEASIEQLDGDIRFDNKFNKKMFIKASNPFHHYKSSTFSEQKDQDSLEKKQQKISPHKSEIISRKKQQQKIQRQYRRKLLIRIK